ncbi:hypothetical protein BGX27_005586 [Mortierella sp. AM989]|nr:hypothetical protein BGX27_005586 [Mortierella sp. AM989]
MTLLSTLSRAQLRDRIRGCLFGCAVGDAYGVVTEFMTKRTVIDLYGNGPIAFGLDPGYPVSEDDPQPMVGRNDFTDDTDQLILLLQSLEQTRNGKLNPINFAQRLLEWYGKGIPEIGTDPGRGLGLTVSRTIHNPMFQSNPHRAAFESWDSSKRDLASNGAVMRTAVLGIESFWDEHRVVENSMAAAKVTHADPRSVVSAILSSVLISRLLRGGGVNVAHDETLIWNSRLSSTAYQEELLAYMRRGTSMQGKHSLNPPYEPVTSANQFQPKNYGALEKKLLEEKKKAAASYKAQFDGRNLSGRNRNRKPVLRPDIGWAGIDNVGEDEAMGSLARSVLADYMFLVQQTDVAPVSTTGLRVQDNWATEFQVHCFPQSLDQLDLGNGKKIGYALKCIGVAYYGATRCEDSSPTAPEYGGPMGLFRGLMEQVTLEGGDADTNDAVLGSLLGARFGLEEGIPHAWWAGLQHSKWLDKIFDQYVERILASYDAQHV